jgi:hypothetical protein
MRRSSATHPRRRDARARGVVIALVAASVSAACGGAEISLQVAPGCCDATNKSFNTQDVGFIHVTVTNGAKTDQGTFPVDTTKQTSFPLKNVDRLRPIHVDVLGCDQAHSACAQTGDASFRGCTVPGNDVPVELDSSCLNGVTNPCTIAVFIELNPLACDTSDADACKLSSACTADLPQQ